MIATLTIKQLAANKMRLIATAFAVVLGVAFLAGTLILTDTIRGTFDTVLAKADAGTDAYVRADSPLELGFGQSGRPLDAELTRHRPRRRRRRPGQHPGLRLRPDPRPRGQGRRHPQTGVLGMNWVTVPALNPFTIDSGRPPTGPTRSRSTSTPPRSPISTSATERRCCRRASTTGNHRRDHPLRRRRHPRRTVGRPVRRRHGASV